MTTASANLTLQVHLGDPIRAAELIERPGVLQGGHFRLLSGLHSDRFVAFSGIANDPAALDQIADWLLPSVAAWLPTTVIAPSTAGVGLASTIARRLGSPLRLATLDLTGRPDGLIGDLPGPSDRVLLVNDVVTTGTGLVALSAIASRCGAAIAGSTWFASRGAVDIPSIVGAPAAFVMTADLPTCNADRCPLCAVHEPLEDALDLN